MAARSSVTVVLKYYMVSQQRRPQLETSMLIHCHNIKIFTVFSKE